VGGALTANSGSSFTNIVLCSGSSYRVEQTPATFTYIDDSSVYPKRAYVMADRFSVSRVGQYDCTDSTLSSFGCFLMCSRNATTNALNNTSIAMESTLTGSSASLAAIRVCTYGGTSCYAMCSNGRISVNNVVCTSDKNLKTDIQQINVLHYLRSLPITKWRFKDGEDYHVGPMAQDFQRVFNFSKEDKTVYGLDGIALKGVQELDECVTTLKNDNAAIRAKLQKLECEMAAIREMIN
jgi:hypothetical protein